MNNSLAEIHPELVSEWSEKNLTLTPDDITFGSNKKVWWRGACGHEWQASVKARSNGEKCPICSGARVIAGINDLATLEPLLVKQWSKKNKIKPTEVSIGSHKKVIWRCEKGHEWEAAVKSRTINKTGCPYCSHNKVLVGFNDLATLAYKMRLEALSRQGKRTDLTSNPLGRKSDGKETAQIIGEQSGDSQTQVRRYIRLTNLVPELLEFVDEGRIKMRPAVELSYLDEDCQRDVVDEIDLNDATPSHDQTIRIQIDNLWRKQTWKIINQ